VRGHLDRALNFLRGASEGRKTYGHPSRIEWKYVLFEWNDSDEEMRTAYELASELGVELSFCLTDTGGGSKRFTIETLNKKLEQIAPGSANLPTLDRIRGESGPEHDHSSTTTSSAVST
jgi:hypothetical protein